MALKINTRNKSGNKRSFWGRILGGIFGLFWSIISLFFVYSLTTSILKQMALYSWEKIPCQIEQFDIQSEKSADPQFKPDILYTYVFQGQSYEGNAFWLTKRGEDYYHKLVERQIFYSEQDSYTCLVNPEKPTESILERNSSSFVSALAVLFFALFFLTIGIATLFVSLKKENPNTTKSKRLGRGKNSDTPLFLRVLGILLLIVALALTIRVFIPKTLNGISTRNWTSTTATVLWSSLKSHKGDDSTTYSIDLFYQYEADGVNHKSNRYSFFRGSDSNYKDKQRFVSKHPRGSSINVFYNPKKPWLATAKKPSPFFLLMNLIPVALFFLGSLLLKRPKSTKLRGNKSSKLFGLNKNIDNTVSGKSLRKKSFFGMLFFAVIWNAIWMTIAYFLFRDWEKADFEWLPVVVLGVFALSGLLLVSVAIYRALQIFGPNYIIDFDKDKIIPGARIPLSWKKQGGFGQADDFKIILSCVEITTYRRGTSSYTDLKVVREDILYETGSSKNIAKGNIDIIIPRDAMPTLTKTNNKIRWSLFVVANVPRWPDVLDEHLFEVSTLSRNDFTV